MVRDAPGNLYGTTYYGGASGYGTVFMVDTTGKETVLHSFTGPGGDGAYPYTGLVRDAAGNLYGTTTTYGAYNYGTVFMLDTTGKVTVLHSFTGGADGATPLGRLVRDAAGNLYGTASAGGASGWGTVFMLDKTGSKVTVLHAFTRKKGDGAIPQAGLVLDAKGNLYGTTVTGGSSHQYGTVFKLNKAGKERVLHRFTLGSDGANPEGDLVRDAKGNLYGSAYTGGASQLYGTVWKLAP